MSRPVVFDVTHLVARVAVPDPTGIDRVDLAYARHFGATDSAGVFACRYGRRRPRMLSVDALRAITRRAEAGWREDIALDEDRVFATVQAWLNGISPSPAPKPNVAARSKAPKLTAVDWKQSIHARPRGTAAVPAKAVYLNAAQFWFEFPRYFAWLDSRPDVKAVFFVHDLLPLDYPEYFRPGYRALFQRRFHTMARWGRAFIVSTNVVGERLRDALAAAGKPQAPVHVAALPSPLSPFGAAMRAGVRGSEPYFVLIGTIEPRKNHLLVLNIWRELAAGGNSVAKLVLVGGRGWEYEQVADMLDRCAPIRPHVFEVARLSGVGLSRLLAGAQALLMPSFDEGYGLPIVEALTLGTPVIASDIAAFREVTQGCALLHSPIDGKGWQETIAALLSRESGSWRAAKAKTAEFQAPDWPSYFAGVEGFLDSL